MPCAFTILFILTVVSVILTWVIPAGSYAKLLYDSSDHCLQVIQPSGKNQLVPATQKQLDKMDVKIDIHQFTSGAINKPVSVPNTYLSTNWFSNGYSTMLNVKYSHWLRFVWPVVLFVLLFGGGAY